ncbi:citrate (pro-3S)-lyase] ligase [Synergistales bacterium]|nr:citrate (pro-3S)-lyase] ligase [Synergistales bacterium]
MPFGFDLLVSRKISPPEREEVISLLARSSLAFDEGAELIALIRSKERDGERLAATASLFGNVIRMVAVDRDFQEEGLSASAVSALLEASRAGGRHHVFIYTKQDAAARFAMIGFKRVAETDTAALLEIGAPGAEDYREYLANSRIDAGAGKIGAIVLNGNPFTLGHRYLIERASELCGALYVIVVEEERSLFSFKDRFAMAELGVKDIGAKNTAVLRSGEYAVSAATFPSYFLKDRAVLSVAEQQTRLDIAVFLNVYAPPLGLNARFAGSEPTSAVTAVYNDTMRRILPQNGIEFFEIERAEAAGKAVSASAVRDMLSSGATEHIREYLPESTITYLIEQLSYKLPI